MMQMQDVAGDSDGNVQWRCSMRPKMMIRLSDLDRNCASDNILHLPR
jgi:hypothetical protein